jgi:hypothetical protein
VAECDRQSCRGAGQAAQLGLPAGQQPASPAAHVLVLLHDVPFPQSVLPEGRQVPSLAQLPVSQIVPSPQSTLPPARQ